MVAITVFLVLTGCGNPGESGPPQAGGSAEQPDSAMPESVVIEPHAAEEIPVEQPAPTVAVGEAAPQPQPVPPPQPVPQPQPDPGVTPADTPPPATPKPKITLTPRGNVPQGRSLLKPRGPVVKGTEGDLDSKGYHTVEVFYGTDRQPSGLETPSGRYGTERNRTGPMEYGRMEVSIPKHHRMGIVERPKWYRLEFSEDPKKHVVILRTDRLEKDAFFDSVTGSAEDRELQEALLFIHGFNVAFDDALRRTAQIAFDLDFGGVAMAFSWPSRASVTAYTVDQGNAQWAVPHLAEFLLDLQENTDLDKIHVIAHSMGTRVLTYALAEAVDLGFDLELNNVILAAPDIDADIFKDQILPKIRNTTDKLTMYASSRDAALKVSQTIHASMRLGQSGGSMLVLDGMDTVDASEIDTSMIGHGYYGSHELVVRDIFNLVIKGLDPPERKLVPGPLGEWDFLDFVKDNAP